MPRIVDIDNDKSIMKIDYGNTKDFITIKSGQILIKPKEIHIGQHSIIITLTDDNIMPLSNVYQILVTVININGEFFKADEFFKNASVNISYSSNL